MGSDAGYRTLLGMQNRMSGRFHLTGTFVLVVASS
jgi:hypothetical protein